MSYGVAMMVNQNDKLSFLSGCFKIKLYKSQRKSNKIRIGLFHSVTRFRICFWHNSALNVPLILCYITSKFWASYLNLWKCNQFWNASLDSWHLLVVSIWLWHNLKWNRACNCWSRFFPPSWFNLQILFWQLHSCFFLHCYDFCNCCYLLCG